MPAPWRHLRRLCLRVARWDLASVELVAERTGERLCTLHPLDKRAHADGVRRRSAPDAHEGGATTDEGTPPALLKRILDEQAASGLPPAWLSHRQSPGRTHDDEHGDPS